ncbi:MAG: YkgJ family cysteine cluster protein, partial [Myxococcales bacterium]|nr:YkgJ family cysteine cluster protein [Myxococcales bacterium]
MQSVTSPAAQALLAQQRQVEADPLFALDAEPRPVESHPACPACGLCCAVPGFRLISPGELWALVDYLDTDLATLQRDYLRADVPMSLRSPCAFLTREGDRFLCRVYPVRPAVCRQFSHCVVLQTEPADAPRLVEQAQARWRAWLPDQGPPDQ